MIRPRIHFLRMIAAIMFPALLSLSLSSVASAGEIAAHSADYYAQNTTALVFTSESGRTMPYRLYLPPDYDPAQTYPLILSFHGAGERGTDNLKQLRPWVAGWMDPEVQKKHPCIILMPQCPAGQQWVDSPFGKGSYSLNTIPMSKSMLLAKELFDEIVREKSIDRSRIYVTGASMGGYATWNFVMRYPELVAAAVPYCGAGDPSRAANLIDIPIWAFHGDQDTIIPPSGSQDMVDAIRKAGGDRIKLTIYEGVQHGSYARAWKTPELVDWVFSQKKMRIQPETSHEK